MRGLFGGRGRGIIRNPRRPLRAAAEPVSSNSNTLPTSKRTKSRRSEHPTSANASLILPPACNTPLSSLINLPSSTDELGWELVGDDRGDCVFGSVPSTDEVHRALSALQQVVGGPSDVSSEDEAVNPMDWVEPPPLLCYSNSKALQLRGSVSDAFHLLETEPFVQRMVVSLSSDRAVWDAVLNNEAVKELRGPISPKADRIKEESDQETNPVKKVLSWIVVKGKAKIIELIDNMMKLASGTEKEGEREGGDDGLQEKLKASLLLSIIVLFIVVITRSNTA